MPDCFFCFQFLTHCLPVRVLRPRRIDRLPLPCSFAREHWAQPEIRHDLSVNADYLTIKNDKFTLSLYKHTIQWSAQLRLLFSKVGIG